MEYILTFNTEAGKKASLNINGIKENITSEQANALMDTIISNNIFNTKSGGYVN